MIFTLEGIDASGKATQAKKLVAKLEKLFPACVQAFDFPRYQTRSGQALASLLKQEWFPEAHAGASVDLVALRALVLQSLMTTNRLEHFDMLRRYCGAPGEFLVLDRYYASGLVYGEADGLPLDYLLDIHQALPPSDLWLFIDIPSEESRKRRPERRDEYEKRAGFMEKVREGYLRLFADPVRVGGKMVVVNGLGTAEEVHDRIIEAVMPFLGGVP